MAQLLTETEDFVQDYQGVRDGASTSSTDPEYDAWFRRKVEAGLRDIREGRLWTADEVDRQAEERIARFRAVRTDGDSK